MACRSGCLTQDHATWGECARAANIKPVWVQHVRGLDRDREKAWERELDSYAAARKQGIQPASTKKRDIEKAVKVSDAFGKAYDASQPTSVIG